MSFFSLKRKLSPLWLGPGLMRQARHPGHKAQGGETAACQPSLPPGASTFGRAEVPGGRGWRLHNSVFLNFVPRTPHLPLKVPTLFILIPYSYFHLLYFAFNRICSAEKQVLLFLFFFNDNGHFRTFPLSTESDIKYSPFHCFLDSLQF